MSEPIITDPSSRAFAKSAVRLLKEYTQSLKDLSLQAIQVADQAMELRVQGRGPGDMKWNRLQNQHNAIMGIFNKIRPAADNLARVVSQRIEHGKMDDLEQAELRLRLAEFEGVLTSAQQIIISSRPQG